MKTCICGHEEKNHNARWGCEIVLFKRKSGDIVYCPCLEYVEAGF